MSVVGALIQGVVPMSDEEMFAGLDERMIDYLKARLSEKPELRSTLCTAARYRALHQRGPRPRVSEHVYFIEASTSGLIKIGCAGDPQARLASLQTGSPEPLRLLATEAGGQPGERVLHRRFAASRSHGEWFRPTADLMAHIEAVS